MSDVSASRNKLFVGEPTTFGGVGIATTRKTTFQLPVNDDCITTVVAFFCGKSNLRSENPNGRYFYQSEAVRGDVAHPLPREHRHGSSIHTSAKGCGNDGLAATQPASRKTRFCIFEIAAGRVR